MTFPKEFIFSLLEVKIDSISVEPDLGSPTINIGLLTLFLASLFFTSLFIKIYYIIIYYNKIVMTDYINN